MSAWIILLVIPKADRLQCEEYFAGFVHGFDVVFISPRRCIVSAKSALAVYSDKVRVDSHSRLEGLVDVLDPGSVALSSNTGDARADTDIAAARDSEASEITNGGVGAASCVSTERDIAHGIVS